MEGRAFGIIIVAAGLVLIVIGVLVAAGALGWFGRLPGDLRFGSGNVRVYIPVLSMLAVSVVLTVVVNLLRRFF